MNFLNQNHSSEFLGKSKLHTVCTTYFRTEKCRKSENFPLYIHYCFNYELEIKVNLTKKYM